MLVVKSDFSNILEAYFSEKAESVFVSPPVCGVDVLGVLYFPGQIRFILVNGSNFKSTVVSRI